MWFDFREANLWDDDGVLTDSIFTLYHPVNINDRRDEYGRLGERRFLEVYQAEVYRITPAEWLRRCFNRLYNATVFVKPEIDMCFARWLSRPDIYQLHKAGLVGFSQGYPIWLFCAWDDDIADPVIVRTPLQKPDVALRSRRLAHEEYLRLYCGWDRWLWGYAHGLLISLAVATVITSRKLRAEPLASLAVTLYLAYLVPYILVSHYERYQVCAGTLQSLILALALCVRARRS
jgi:hypothetical protein